MYILPVVEISMQNERNKFRFWSGHLGEVVAGRET
jgi:hypothetical protein